MPEVVEGRNAVARAYTRLETRRDARGHVGDATSFTLFHAAYGTRSC